jgi:hypothetical protein
MTQYFPPNLIAGCLEVSMHTHFFPLVSDECKISYKQLFSYVKIHTNDFKNFFYRWNYLEQRILNNILFEGDTHDN